MLWVIFTENSPNSRPASPNFSTCSSTASTVIPNNYKRIMPAGSSCGNDTCASDYIESSHVAAAVVVTDCHNGDSDQANYCTPGGGGALMMVQAAVIIGPKDENIGNYGTKEMQEATKLNHNNITLSVWNEISPNSAKLITQFLFVPNFDRFAKFEIQIFCVGSAFYFCKCIFLSILFSETLIVNSLSWNRCTN